MPPLGFYLNHLLAAQKPLKKLPDQRPSPTPMFALASGWETLCGPVVSKTNGLLLRVGSSSTHGLPWFTPNQQLAHVRVLARQYGGPIGTPRLFY